METMLHYSQNHEKRNIWKNSKGGFRHEELVSNGKCGKLIAVHYCVFFLSHVKGRIKASGIYNILWNKGSGRPAPLVIFPFHCSLERMHILRFSSVLKVSPFLVPSQWISDLIEKDAYPPQDLEAAANLCANIIASPRNKQTHCWWAVLLVCTDIKHPQYEGSGGEKSKLWLAIYQRM